MKISHINIIYDKTPTSQQNILSISYHKDMKNMEETQVEYLGFFHIFHIFSLFSLSFFKIVPEEK
jgi:hypothetical protein